MASQQIPYAGRTLCRRRRCPGGLLVAIFIPAILALGLVLPSGCSRDDASAAGETTTSFHVFFHNDVLSGDPSDCEAVFPVQRSAPRDPAVAAMALRSLFAGPTPDERVQGYRSFFSAATAGLLKSVRIESGVAYVDLHDPRALLAGATSSCGSAELLSEMLATLRQFPTVERAIYAIEDDRQAFYQWMGED
jgi:hypothetical protein